MIDLTWLRCRRVVDRGLDPYVANEVYLATDLPALAEFERMTDDALAAFGQTTQGGRNT